MDIAFGRVTPGLHAAHFPFCQLSAAGAIPDAAAPLPIRAAQPSNDWGSGRGGEGSLLHGKEMALDAN